MTRSLLVASALALVVIVAAPRAHAFTVDGQTGNTSDGAPRFVDPDENAEKMADPSGSGTFRIQGGGDSAVGFGAAPVFAAPPVPNAALLGAGEHGFNANTRYH